MPFPPHESDGPRGLPAHPRRAFRYTTNISVLAALLNHGQEKKLPDTRLRNISCTGARILSRVSLPIGETISLHFYLPESGQPFRATAQVVWSDSQGHCGVRFDDVSALHLQRLELWLAGKAFEQQASAEMTTLPVAASILDS